MRTIELPDEQVAALEAIAGRQGLSIERWLRQFTDGETGPPKPLKSAYGLLAEFGPAPSAEEIDANRREMLTGKP